MPTSRGAVAAWLEQAPDELVDLLAELAPSEAVRRGQRARLAAQDIREATRMEQPISATAWADEAGCDRGTPLRWARSGLVRGWDAGKRVAPRGGWREAAQAVGGRGRRKSTTEKGSE